MSEVVVGRSQAATGAEQSGDSAGAATVLLGPFAVAFAEGAAAFMAACSLVLLVVGHTENVEFALYLVAFAGVLPLAFASGRSRQRSLSPRELSVLGAIDGAAVAVALVVGRLAGAGPRQFLFAGIAILALSELLWGPFRSVLASAAAHALPTDELSVLFFFVAGAVFLPSWTYGSKGFWAAFPIALALAWVGGRTIRPYRVALVVDFLAVLLITSTIWDIFFWDGYVADNHNYYLGPVNEVLHGRTMLVDDFAQYGVGVIYFLAGVFKLIPIGYGTFDLLLSLLTAIQFALLYFIVRLAGRSQLIAVLASAVAIVFVIYGQVYQSFVAYPSTGVLRFGPPYVVILLEVLAVRRPAGRLRLQQASAAVTAVASLWSFETFAYTLVAYLAIVALDAVADGNSLREVVRRRLFPLVGFVVLAHLLFAIGTRAASGSWPDWKTYLDYIRLYSVQGFYTLPVTPWDPGFLIAGVCFASALLLALVAIRRPAIVGQRRDLFAALAGSTAFAILAFTYFVGRSHPNNLHHVAPPVIMACALWLSLLAERPPLLRPTARFALLSVAVWSVFMLAEGSQRELRAKWTNSVLGTLVSDGPQAVNDRFRFLAERPPIDPREYEAVALLDQFDPGSSQSLVLLEPELTTAVLLRADRGNAVPIATPPQDIVLPAAVRRVLAAVPELHPGTIMLADSRYLAAPPNSYADAPLTQLTVWEVQRFFALRTLTQSNQGLAIVQLEHRLAG